MALLAVPELLIVQDLLLMLLQTLVLSKPVLMGVCDSVSLKDMSYYGLT